MERWPSCTTHDKFQQHPILLELAMQLHWSYQHLLRPEQQAQLEEQVQQVESVTYLSSWLPWLQLASALMAEEPFLSASPKSCLGQQMQQQQISLALQLLSIFSEYHTLQ